MSASGTTSSRIATSASRWSKPPGSSAPSFPANTCPSPHHFNFNDAGRASATIPQASGSLLAIWNAMVDLVRFDRPLGGLSASLRVERNNVECRIASKQFTGHTLFLYTLLRERFGGGSAMVDANRLISLQAAMAAAVVGPSAATINGNFVAAPT